jgi:hypothetical protein
MENKDCQIDHEHLQNNKMKCHSNFFKSKNQKYENWIHML